MYYISDLCRVCLKNENSTVDIIKKETEHDPLINKLKLCVSEVEWSASSSILMCASCIERLNTAYEFKNQCLQSTKLFESYVYELNESESEKTLSNVYVNLNREDVTQQQIDNYISMQTELEQSQKPSTFLRVKSNQQLYPQQIPNIILAPNSNTPNTFQNIFLNLIPSAAIKYPAPNVTIMNNIKSLPPIKENQNMFLNINNTLHKIFPIVSSSSDVKPTPPFPMKLPEDLNISKLLTESKTEELSVDIDPMCFECSPEDDSRSDGASIAKEWEDLVLQNKGTSESVQALPHISIPALAKLTDTIETFAPLPPPPIDVKHNPVKVEKTFVPPSITMNNFVPIRPKVKNYLVPELDNKVIDFFNVDHFMAGKHQIKSVVCEQCGQMCDTIKVLHAHIKQIHQGDFPYRCKQCSSVYALRTQYDAHVKKHELQKDMITLDDLSQQNESILFPNSLPHTGDDTISVPDEGEHNLNLEFKCDVCPTSFNHVHSLTRHKMNKHPQQRRKYFVKGMKNAKCDICNREFSTQSYLQLHIKLHYRKNDYRLKVFNKDKYNNDKQDAEAQVEQSDVDDANCDKSVDDKENADENTPEKNDQNYSSANEESELKTTQGQGLKIKINLRTLKQAQTDESPLVENNNVTNGGTCEPEETPMDVEDENKTVSGGELDISSENNDALADVTMDCEQRDNLATEVDSVEESPPVKDEGLPQMQRPPISAELVNGKQQCAFCLKLYRRKHDLKRHLNNIHLKAIQYVCHLCQSPFYEAFQLTRHLRQHNGFVRCGTCLKEYSILRDLKLHISAAHDNTAFCQCGTCGQSFQRIRYLREHMHDHDKSIIYKCHLCTEDFKESRDLSRHLVEHSGMYACNICHTTFSAEQELNNHSKCHSDDPANERKYKCEICPSKFKKKRYLMAHIKKTHPSKNDEDVLSTIAELDCKSA